MKGRVVGYSKGLPCQSYILIGSLCCLLICCAFADDIFSVFLLRIHQGEGHWKSDLPGETSAAYNRNNMTKWGIDPTSRSKITLHKKASLLQLSCRGIDWAVSSGSEPYVPAAPFVLWSVIGHKTTPFFHVPPGQSRIYCGGGRQILPSRIYQTLQGFAGEFQQSRIYCNGSRGDSAPPFTTLNHLWWGDVAAPQAVCLPLSQSTLCTSLPVVWRTKEEESLGIRPQAQFAQNKFLSSIFLFPFLSAMPNPFVFVFENEVEKIFF